MTLIFSYVDAVTGLFSASDVAISIPSEKNRSLIKIPLRRTPFKHEGSAYSVAGLSQKSIIRGRTLIQYAGWQVVARTIVKEILKHSDNGRKQVEVLPIVHGMGLSEKELSETSILYHFNDSPETVYRAAINCEILDHGGDQELIGSGSGTWHFFKDMFVSRGEALPRGEKFIAEFITKIVTTAILESSQGSINLDHLYGGWFELLAKTENSFEKRTYAIKYWSRDGDILGSGGPAFYGFYGGEVLIIAEMRPYEEQGKFKQKSTYHFVGPLLGGPVELVPPKEPTRPNLIAHVVWDVQTQRVDVLVDGRPSEETMLLEVSERGMRVRWNNALRERLWKLNPTDADLGIGLNYS